MYYRVVPLVLPLIGRNFRDTAGAGTSLFLLEHNPESGQSIVIGTERVGAAVHLEDFANKD